MVWENQVAVADTGSRNGVERWTDRSCDRREKIKPQTAKPTITLCVFSSIIIDSLSV